MDTKQLLHDEECDWCGAESLCLRVKKPDGMPGDKCVSCAEADGEDKLNAITAIVNTYYNGHYIPVTTASWYFDKLRFCLEEIEKLKRSKE